MVETLDTLSSTQPSLLQLSYTLSLTPLQTGQENRSTYLKEKHSTRNQTHTIPLTLLSPPNPPHLHIPIYPPLPSKLNTPNVEPPPSLNPSLLSPPPPSLQTKSPKTFYISFPPLPSPPPCESERLSGDISRLQDKRGPLASRWYESAPLRTRRRGGRRPLGVELLGLCPLHSHVGERGGHDENPDQKRRRLGNGRGGRFSNRRDRSL